MGWRDYHPYCLLGEAVRECSRLRIHNRKVRDRFIVYVQPLIEKLVHMQLKGMRFWRDEWMDDVVSYVNLNLLGQWWGRFSVSILEHQQKGGSFEDGGFVRGLLRWLIKSVRGYTLNYLRRFRYPDNNLDCGCVYSGEGSRFIINVDFLLDIESIHRAAKCLSEYHLKSRMPRLGVRKERELSDLVLDLAHRQVVDHYLCTGELL